MLRPVLPGGVVRRRSRARAPAGRRDRGRHPVGTPDAGRAGHAGRAARPRADGRTPRLRYASRYVTVAGVADRCWSCVWPARRSVRVGRDASGFVLDPQLPPRLRRDGAALRHARSRLSERDMTVSMTTRAIRASTAGRCWSPAADRASARASSSISARRAPRGRSSSSTRVHRGGDGGRTARARRATCRVWRTSTCATSPATRAAVAELARRDRRRSGCSSTMPAMTTGTGPGDSDARLLGRPLRHQSAAPVLRRAGRAPGRWRRPAAAPSSTWARSPG